MPSLGPFVQKIANDSVGAIRVIDGSALGIGIFVQDGTAQGIGIKVSVQTNPNSGGMFVRFN